MSSFNLGQQFQAYSTQYEVPVKTPDGRTFYEVLPELQAKFKPSEHSEYPTGRNREGQSTFYCYIKWQFIRKRLDDVVGVGGWLIERTGMFIDESGNPCIIGRMNILGIVKESMGIGKAHEKWQGTKIENAIADLLKNCAEEFGIGRYLDDQRATIQHLWDNAGTDEYIKSMARKLGAQHKLQLNAQTAENNAVASGKPTPKPQARKAENTNLLDTDDIVPRTPPKSQPTEAAEPYPQHNAFFNAFAEEFKFQGVYAFVKQVIAANWQGRSRPGHLAQEELEILMEVVACEWAVGMGLFEEIELARNAYQGKLALLKAKGNYTIGEVKGWAIAWRDAQLSSKRQPVGAK